MLFFTCHPIRFHFWTCNKVVYFHINFVIKVLINFEIFILDLPCFVCSFTCLPLCSLFLLWQFMFSSCNLSQSGIPKNADPLHGTRKKMDRYTLPLSIMVTLHIPICDTHELLYACNIFVSSLI